MNKEKLIDLIKKIGESKSFTVTKAFVQEKLDRARLTRLQKAG